MPGHDVATTPLAKTVRVELDGELVAEGADVVALTETGLPTRYYFRPEDVRPELLRASSSHTHCPFKGEASYYDLVTERGEHPDFVWYYPDPIEQVEAIRGRLAFYNDRVELFVDGEPEG
jgi:uncharacterized protein (DUF427 family)